MTLVCLIGTTVGDTSKPRTTRRRGCTWARSLRILSQGFGSFILYCGVNWAVSAIPSKQCGVDLGMGHAFIDECCGTNAYVDQMHAYLYHRLLTVLHMQICCMLVSDLPVSGSARTLHVK